MGKDPAFLFYPGDWLGGTMLYTRHQKGAYMDLLMGQFHNGHLSTDDIQGILGPDFETLWESKLKAKFTQDQEGRWYNVKLETEMIKRKNYTTSRKENLAKTKTGPATAPQEGPKKQIKSKAHKGKHKEPHMESHMENGNENRIEEEKEGGGTAWDRWKEYKKNQFGFTYKDKAEPIARERLYEMAGGDEQQALKIVNQSIDYGWKGLFELKNNSYAPGQKNSRNPDRGNHRNQSDHTMPGKQYGQL